MTHSASAVTAAASAGRALPRDELLEVAEHRAAPGREMREEVAGTRRRAHARSSSVSSVNRERTSRRTATPIPGPSGTGIRPFVASGLGSTMSSSK